MKIYVTHNKFIPLTITFDKSTFCLIMSAFQIEKIHLYFISPEIFRYKNEENRRKIYNISRTGSSELKMFSLNLLINQDLFKRELL